MKTLKLPSDREDAVSARRAPHDWLPAAFVLLLGLSWDVAICRAQQPGNDVAGAQVLTRGPVHEAFAGIVAFNPEPGVVTTKAPPDVIEELPPEERPEGDNVAWIPGYWAWDDERSDFLWISGTWRALPPGREWIAGYWAPTTQGHQWISGYWADASARETTYLPPPPVTVEVGPNIAAPSLDYGWTPGCWIWYQGRYAWRPGYWAQGRADWVWIPSHYVWTPRGYIFVGGFWDYPVERRGLLFAPVYFESVVYSRRGYRYSPTIVINLSLFNDHLFLRPRYHHYYFGDYYATSYQQSGFYASYSFQSSRHGYDPFYSHQRWAHRQDREWEQRVVASYQYRRDHETARPPRTWTAQRSINPGAPESTQNRVLVAAPIDQLARRTDSPVRFQPVARDERQSLSQRGQEVQQSREQRRTLEARAESTAVRKSGEVVEPAKVTLPRSPIVARPGSQSGRNQIPPQAPQAPTPDLKVQPRSETSSRQPNVDRSNPQPDPRRSESIRTSAPGRGDVAPRERQVLPESQPRGNDAATKAQEESQRRAKDAERAAQLESQPPAKDPPAKSRGESQRNLKGLEQKAQQESERRAKDAAAKTQEDSQRNALGLEKKTQQESQQRATDAAAKAQEQAQRNAQAVEQNAQQESERRAKEAAAKIAEDAQRNARGVERKAQPEPDPRAKGPPVRISEEPQRNAKGAEGKGKKAPEPPAKGEPAAAEKGASTPVNKGQEPERKGKTSPPDERPE